MKILILDTYYAAFLAATYAAHPELARKEYDEQLKVLLDQCFGTSDFYSRHLKGMGHEAEDLVFNSAPLQAAWSRQSGIAFLHSFLKIPPRAYRLPVLGRLLARLPGLLDVAIAQIKAFKPDVLYCQDLNVIPPAAMSEIRRYAKLIVGQIASPLPPADFLRPYDLVLTSFPHFVPRLRQMGVSSEYFRIGFDTKVLSEVGEVSKDVEASFVGGISRNHGKALPMLEYLAERTPIQFFGYGLKSLPPSSPIGRRHRGEVWGLNMYRALARSRVTLNRHIDVAENNANNMRLFEATGVGTLLVTDAKDNLGELFKVGKEVVAYSSKEEAAELITYYINNPKEAEEIARAGQVRTLAEHTYERRMQELVPILERYLRGAI